MKIIFTYVYDLELYQFIKTYNIGHDNYENFKGWLYLTKHISAYYMCQHFNFVFITFEITFRKSSIVMFTHFYKQFAITMITSKVFQLFNFQQEAILQYNYDTAIHTW